MKDKNSCSGERLQNGDCRVLIVSPQPWDGFRVSKHHYACELSKLGNRIFFVDPPDLSVRRGAIRLSPARTVNVTVVRYRPWIPYKTKFHLRTLFDPAMRRQARRIARACGGDLDVVWDFDNAYNFVSLKAFGAPVSIFHPVDQLIAGQSSSKDADLVVGIAESILARIDSGATPCIQVGHGLSQSFVDYGKQQLQSYNRNRAAGTVNVGYVGNLMAHAIDGRTIVCTVQQNADVEFHFFGPFESGAVRWIQSLHQCPNTHFHGLCTQEKILANAPGIDMWLLCYDNARDINGGADSHKVLEYLATGVPVVSSNLDAYKGRGLINMCSSKLNDEFPRLFVDTLNSLPDRTTCRTARIEFAINNSYSSRLSSICSYLSDMSLDI
ncbi:MAG TPA: hypothetical protein EYQ63_17820 [Fuerstia sp.]|nr:hypothetical protein [Fuerstiella sp.]